MAQVKVFIEILILLVFTHFLFIKPVQVLCASEVKCIERERQALLKFKHGVVDDYGFLSSWGSGDGERECCEWSGVKCSNKTGHVVELNLYAMFSGGNISPTLLELQYLEHLDLGNNSFRVDNLKWLPHLSLLRYLDLSGNNLNETNNWIQQISKLSSLEELHLSDCQLSDPLPPAFANFSLSSLTLLDLSFNNLSSFAIFESLFNSSTHLASIRLNSNKFNGPIPDSFGSLNFLEVLWLYGNKLNEIPPSLGNLNHLRNLSLSDNAFNQPVAQIFQNLSTGISLEEIDLSNNQLVGSLSDITQFSSLQRLVLSNNQLTGFLPHSPTQPSSLVFLDLSHNKIGGSFPELSAFSSLQELYIAGNQITGLPASLWQLGKLTVLDIMFNPLKGTITEDQLSNLPNLWFLQLYSISLNISSGWIPPFQLQLLGFKYCNVGPVFPKWLQTQRNISYIEMSFAGISDTLPIWIWDMPNLFYFNLSHNHISGRIPLHHFPGYALVDLSNNNLAGLVPLFLFHSIKLQLSKNKFSGSISHLCGAANDSNMELLDLSSNQFTGELPDCWSNTTSLRIVNLANNNFTGQISSAFGSMHQLEILHLRNNSFTGELPPSLKNCTQLRMLDVGGNKLTGTIPQWIGTHLTSLTVLSLRFNRFHGTINTAICHLADLQILDLSRNNLSGEIPKCFNSLISLLQKNSSADGIVLSYMEFYVDNILVQWKGRESEYKKVVILKGIDLSNNNLVGTIPQELSDLRGLVFFNLSRNHLIGNIMSNIGQMEMLEWLDLSRNELSGPIPNSLAQLTFLSVLDLSFNNLRGKIPIGTQLQSFNSSAYVGSNQLCGLPLRVCPPDSPYPSSIDHDEGNIAEEHDGLINRDFYICMALGFITGFWMVVGTLIVKNSWRQSYFNFVDKIGDGMHVTLAICVARFKRISGQMVKSFRE